MVNSLNPDAPKHRPTEAATTVLLADVGGTNTRLALARSGRFDESQRFENENVASFYDLAQSFLAASNVKGLDACSVAMAGPVRNGEGNLTNRDWSISAEQLKRTLHCKDAVLLNDLTAIGHALGTLQSQSLAVIDAPKSALQNGQALVIGIGTGFNFAPVKKGRDGSLRCFEVEMGHAAFPAPLRDRLSGYRGGDIQEFQTLERLFSGAGLARFHHAKTGQSLSAREVVEAHEAGDAAAGETLEQFSILLGQLCRELVYQYMPLDGIYFAGSVARGVLRPEFHQNVLGDVEATDKMSDLLAHIPKFTILDDAVALHGCHAALGGH